jgi:hypothetical protein
LKHFHLIGRGLDMTPLHHALIRQPELWNQNEYRTKYAGTPHIDVDDIWLRYSAQERTADLEDHKPVQNDHSAVWYPAANKLPEAKPLIVNLMAYLGAYDLGRVVISRIPPGGRITPHADVQGDYVHLGDIARYHLVVQGLPGSMFYCGGEQVNMQTGETWWFDAHAEHEVKNNSADDRIHLMCDLRKWPC